MPAATLDAVADVRAQVARQRRHLDPQVAGGCQEPVAADGLDGERAGAGEVAGQLEVAAGGRDGQRAHRRGPDLDVAGHRPDDEVRVGRGDDVQVTRDGLDGDPAGDGVEGHLARRRPVPLVAEEAVRLDLGARGLDDDRRSMGQVDLDGPGRDPRRAGRRRTRGRRCRRRGRSRRACRGPVRPARERGAVSPSTACSRISPSRSRSLTIPSDPMGCSRLEPAVTVVIAWSSRARGWRSPPRLRSSHGVPRPRGSPPGSGR